MKTLTKIALLAALAVMACTASAQVFDWTLDSGTDGKANIIPDGDPSGLTDTRTITGVPTSDGGFFMRVKLAIQGYTLGSGDNTFTANPKNGDYYATLSKVGFGDKAVLLNRVGRPEGAGLGYGDSGLNITLQDFAGPLSGTAVNDIHTYQNVLGHQFQNPLTGTWAPDGRGTDPTTVTAGDARTKMLSIFNNLTDVNGDWVLSVIDNSAGDSGKLTSWGLEFIAVPEPHEYALIAGLGLIGFALYRRYALKAA